MHWKEFCRMAQGVAGALPAFDGQGEALEIWAMQGLE